MDRIEDLLKPPKEFPFPFPPYSIQHDFMTHLYCALEEGKLGIFESPTGTGKSLSIICGSLLWLKDHEAREKRVLENTIEKLTKEKSEVQESDDWVTSQAHAIKIDNQKRIIEQKLSKINQQDIKIQEMKERSYVKKNTLKSSKKFENNNESEIEKDDDIELIENDDFLLEEMDTVHNTIPESDDEEETEDVYQGVKIIVCSRTHSQLSQFIHEVQRSPHNDVRLVPLASRQNFCINPNVRKLKSLTLINERCTDLQRGAKGKKTETSSDGKMVKKSRTTCGCPYLKVQQAMTKLTEEMLVSIQDIEALVSHGQKLSSCPYYATRNAMADAQVVVVPYNTLLHKSTRKACGLHIKGNVIIIDEAHNLLDTIAQVHSSQVSGYQLIHARSQLSQYRDRYHKRFSATNLLYLEQLLFILGCLIKILGGKPGCNPADNVKDTDSKLYSLPEFVLAAEIDNFNLYSLLAFCNKSKLSQKLHGFSEHYQPSVSIRGVSKAQQLTGVQAFLKEITNKKTKPVEEDQEQETKDTTSNNPILPVIAFLEALTNHCDDGRVVCFKKTTIGQGTLKFLLLNPASHFSEIVQQARSVIVAGGTMQPVSEFREQLFLRAGAPLSRVIEYSCGHVIPPDHILPIVLTQGSSGIQLNFSYGNRNIPAMLNEIGTVLDNVCTIVPAGIVCFFPSYDYEQTVYQFLEKSGTIAKLAAKKQIFREPRCSGQVDQVLADFAAAVNKAKGFRNVRPNGGLLFSVVGGKLSEGLNFSDDLGRCVIVVGMPFPNIKCPELQEKMAYLNSQVEKTAGQRHYQNLCMKAVNQCIGRAVRHKADYATVLLLDQRYARPSVQKMLPQWIITSLQTHHRVSPAILEIAKFFAAKYMDQIAAAT